MGLESGRKGGWKRVVGLALCFVERYGPLKWVEEHS